MPVGTKSSTAEQYRGPAAQALEPMLQTCLGRAEGGLVLYQHLPWYYVALPQESFEPLFRACLAP